MNTPDQNPKPQGWAESTVKSSDDETIERAHVYHVGRPMNNIMPPWLQEEDNYIGSLLDIVDRIRAEVKVHKLAIETLEARDRTMLGTRNDLQFKADEVRHCLRNFVSAVQRYVNVAQRPQISPGAQAEYDEAAKALFQAMEFAKAFGRTP